MGDVESRSVVRANIAGSAEGWLQIVRVARVGSIHDVEEAGAIGVVFVANEPDAVPAKLERHFSKNVLHLTHRWVPARGGGGGARGGVWVRYRYGFSRPPHCTATTARARARTHTRRRSLLAPISHHRARTVE